MQFKYIAIDKDGATKSDVVEAISYHEAVSLLHQQGMIPTSIKEVGKRNTFEMINKIATVGLQDKILFVQNLAVMLKAGISLTKALQILASQSNNPRMKDILQHVLADVQAGKSMSEGLERYPRTFQNVFISMFRVGEASGTLEKSLEQLSIQLQREHDLTSKTKGAMIYPAVVVFAIVIVGILMSIYVLPSLVGIFKDSGMQLPLMTRIVIGFVDFMSNHTLLAIGSIIGVVAGVILILRTESGMRIFDKILLRTPVIAEVDKKINMARFSRTMSSMLKSGTPILESLQIASESMGNYEYKEAIQKATQEVRIGNTLTSALSKYPRLFDYIVVQMIGVGEESGNVDTILSEIAARYEGEVDDTMKNMSSVIEPLMILFIGTIVGILALALISPIYNLTANAGN